MTTINLRRLEYFLAVAEELHFGRAAERLHMAQPPLSRQIMQLEAELDATLFDRGRGQIRLTQAGEALLRRAGEMLETMSDAAIEVRCIDQGAKGRLRMAFVGSATHGILPNLVKAYRAKYPEVNLSLLVMNNAQQHRALIRRDIDVAIGRGSNIDDPEIVSVPIHQELLVLASSCESKFFASNAPIELAKLEGADLVLYPHFPRPSFADVVIDLCRKAGFEPREPVFCMDYQTAIGLVSVNVGVSIVPASVGTTGHQGVTFTPIADADATTQLFVAYRRDNREKHVQRLLEIAKASCASGK